MAQITAEQFLTGGGSSVKFGGIGDSVAGVVTQEPEIVQANNFKTGLPDFWDEAKLRPKYQLVVTLKTAEVDTTDPSDDGIRRLFVKPGNMQKAVGAACKAAGVKGVAVGGKLFVQYTADGISTGGNNPPKEYAAKYVPPTATEVPVPEGKPAAPSAATPAGLDAAAEAALKALLT